jgi:hypothetical protein
MSPQGVSNAIPAAAAAAVSAVISSTIDSMVCAETAGHGADGTAVSAAIAGGTENAAPAIPATPAMPATVAPSGVPGEPSAQPSSHMAGPTSLPELAGLLTGLYVNTSAAGPREARMVLSDDVLPMTSVSIAEESGRVAVRFHCGIPAAREQLCSRAPWLAGELASRLARDVVLTVGHEDLDTPWAAQVYADAPEA